jgi:hypothetical protein
VGVVVWWLVVGVLVVETPVLYRGFGWWKRKGFGGRGDGGADGCVCWCLKNVMGAAWDERFRSSGRLVEDARCFVVVGLFVEDSASREITSEAGMAERGL